MQNRTLNDYIMIFEAQDSFFLRTGDPETWLYIVWCNERDLSLFASVSDTMTAISSPSEPAAADPVFFSVLTRGFLKFVIDMDDYYSREDVEAVRAFHHSVTAYTARKNKKTWRVSIVRAKEDPSDMCRRILERRNLVHSLRTEQSKTR